MPISRTQKKVEFAISGGTIFCYNFILVLGSTYQNCKFRVFNSVQFYLISLYDYIISFLPIKLTISLLNSIFQYTSFFKIANVGIRTDNLRDARCAHCWMQPYVLSCYKTYNTSATLLNGPSPTSFCLFSFFSSNILEKNCRLQLDLNQDCLSRRRAR